MNIKVEIDDAKIMRDVMSGLSTKDMEKRIVHDILNTIKERVVSKLSVTIDELKEKYVRLAEAKADSWLEEEVSAKLKKFSTPKAMKKYFNSDDFNDKLWEKINEVINCQLDHYTIGLNIQPPKGKKKFCNCGATAKGDWE